MHVEGLFEMLIHKSCAKMACLLWRQLRNAGSGIWGGLLSLRFFEGTARQNSKGCDIGYALAISSCEEANSVEACTVTALDAITAFAVPNPNCCSQSRRKHNELFVFDLSARTDSGRMVSNPETVSVADRSRYLSLWCFRLDWSRFCRRLNSPKQYSGNFSRP
jgi:hypothetical protein